MPFAAATLVAIPNEVSDEQAIPVSDIFPTGYFGAEAAEIQPGDTVAVFGCGPVGLFAITSAGLLGARRTQKAAESAGDKKLPHIAGKSFRYTGHAAV